MHHTSDELKRQHEEMRLRHLELLAALRDSEKMRRAEDERKKEVEVQQKLGEMRIYPSGNQWVKQDGGYRCSAG